MSEELLYNKHFPITISVTVLFSPRHVHTVTCVEIASTHLSAEQDLMLNLILTYHTTCLSDKSHCARKSITFPHTQELKVSILLLICKILTFWVYSACSPLFLLARVSDLEDLCRWRSRLGMMSDGVSRAHL